MMSEVFIGIVQNGAFTLLFPGSGNSTRIRLTSTSMQDSVPPENGELNLVEYENSAIAVEGHAGGAWIYSTSIIDTGEPIVTALVKSVFGR